MQRSVAGRETLAEEALFASRAAMVTDVEMDATVC
jgi:hypothetical protein